MSKIDMKKVYYFNEKLFLELDYEFTRYKVNYSLCLIEFNNQIKNLKNFEQILINKLRYTDKIIKINDYVFLLILKHNKIEQANSTILNLEKNLDKEFDFKYDKIFNFSILEKNSFLSKDYKEIEKNTLEILEELNLLLNNNDNNYILKN